VKPYDPNALATEIRSLAGRGARVAFVSGDFNVVHPGHLRLLRFAADCGDFLVVGVLDQRSEGAVLSEELRLEGVRSIGLVDFAFVLRGPPSSFVSALEPAIVVKGKEHEVQLNPESQAVDAYGGKLLFSSGEVSFSSLDLLKREFSESALSSITLPAGYPQRHGFAALDLKKLLDGLSSLRVTVVGDLIVDEYLSCEPLGMSQEDPSLVVTPLQKSRFLGGAAIVAAHASGLGARVRHFSVVGADETSVFALGQLNELGVESELVEDVSRPTPLKQRFRAGSTTLLRVSHLRQHAISRELSARLAAKIRDVLDDTDLLIFSDFSYGCLPQHLIDEIAGECRGRAIMMAADSQSSSQIGDLLRFKDMDLVTPTERETRLAIRDFDSGLAVISDVLRSRCGARHVIVTLGAEGLLVHAPSARDGNVQTDRLPAFNSAPKDPAGAGDSLLICSAMALAAGADIWRSAFLGSLAAAVQVGRLGNSPLSPDELRAELDSASRRWR